MMMTDNSRKLLNILLLLGSILVIPSLIGVSPTGSPVGSTSPFHGMVVTTAPDGESIGISDGTFAFDTNRPDGDLKHRAADRLKMGDTSGAESLWADALANNTNDAELLIYQEDQRVLTSGRPHITLVVGTVLTGAFANTGRNGLQGVYVAQKEYNNQYLKFPDCVQVRLLVASPGSGDGSNAGAGYASLVMEQIAHASLTDKTIVGVMGWSLSSSSLYANTVLGSHTPVVSPTASTASSVVSSSYFFRVTPSDRQGSIGAEYAEQALHARQVAIFVDPVDRYSESLAKAFSQQFIFFHDATNVPDKKGGIGKTWLLRKCTRIARERYENMAVAAVDFFSVADRDGVEVAQCIVKSLQEVHPEWSPEFFTDALAEYYEGISTNKDLNELRDKLHAALTNDLQILDTQLVGANRQLLVFFDTYEVIEAYPTVSVLSPAYAFPDQYQFKRMGVVIAGRNVPDWEHPNWRGHTQEEVQCVPINPFTQEETVQFINHNVDVMGSIEVQSTQAQALYACTEGRPILVGLVADMLNHRVMTLNQLLEIPTDRFEPYLVEQINNLAKPINWVILFMAQIYHRFNEKLLDWLFDHSLGIKELVQDVQTHELSKKLLELSFVRRSGSGDNVVLHDEMRRLVNKYNWTVQEQQTRRYRRGLSLGAISYYLDQIVGDLIQINESSEPMHQTYQVEMLLYVDVNEGFRFFEQHIKRANDLWQSAFARSLLQEAQQFTNDFSPEQYYSMILAETGLLLREEDNKAALKLYEKLEQEADESWLVSHRGDILFQKGNCYQQMSNFPEAITCFTNSLKIETARGNESRSAAILADAYRGRAQIFDELALLNYQKLRQLAVLSSAIGKLLVQPRGNSAGG